jgi:NTE family protein
MSWRRKIDDQSLLVDLEIGLSSSGIELPTGIIQGAKISQLFRNLTLRGLSKENFDKLRLPYRAVAMDVINGETVVLDHGDLALAMRASMSIAGAFAPVEIDGKLLVDGGYVDNLPVDVAERFGADVVIAVDVGTPPIGDVKKLNSVFAMSSQVQDVVVAVGRRAARARLGADDVLILPELGDISFVDFASAGKAIGLGYTAAVQKVDSLTRLAVDEKTWNEYLARQRAPAYTPPPVRSVTIENKSGISTRTLEEIVHVRAGQSLDPDAVRVDLERLNGLGIFESVDFRVTPHDDGVDLTYVVREKQWGPNYLRFGVALNEDFSGRSNYELGIGVTITPINDLGAELRTEFHIGSRLGIATEFYQPLDHAMRWFVAPRALILRRQLNLDRGAQSDVDYTIDEWGFGLDVGRALGSWGEARVGIERSAGDIDAQSSVPLPEEGTYTDVSLVASLACDTLDKRDFPHDGLLGRLSGYVTRENLGADDDSDRAYLTLAGYQTWGEVTGSAAIELGTSMGSDLPLQQKFLLGGFGRLSGLAPNSIAGDELALLRLGGFVELGGSLVPTYAGMTAELGNVWDDEQAVSSSQLDPSLSAFFGADTPLGPLILGVGIADEGQSAVFLLLGRRP